MPLSNQLEGHNFVAKQELRGQAGCLRTHVNCVWFLFILVWLLYSTKYINETQLLSTLILNTA